MNDEQFMNIGAQVVITFLAGPELWAEIPTPDLSGQQEHLDNMHDVIRQVPASADATWIESQKAVCHAVIDRLGAEMMIWAVLSGRQDLLKTCGQIMREAEQKNG
jgi:hypothetical protein